LGDDGKEAYMGDPSTLADITAAVAAFGNGDREAIRRMLGRDYFEHVPGPTARPD
jgi:hypothetical protein